MTSSLDDRLTALESAAAAAEGRLREDQLAPAREALSRASVRLRKSAEHTIVALGGATGSGKSSLFNALSGIDLAGVGIKRPTTSWTLACTWGPGDASELLSWIGIPPRHQLTRRGPLDDDTDASLDGLVLLDMPDHDSMLDAHQAEVDRIVEFADLFIWVLDPQKYADAAIHDRYLKPLAQHSGTTVVVMNQIDRLSDADRETVLADLRQILNREGLGDVPIIATSARSGLGLDDLRAEIARRAESKNAASTRLGADVRKAAEHLAEAGGTDEARGLTDDDREQLVDAVTESAGTSQLASIAESSTLYAGAVTTDWPPFALAARRRKNPLDPYLEGPVDAAGGASVDRARAELAIRQAAETAASGAAEPWRISMVRAASAAGTAVDRVDMDVRALDLRTRPKNAWWPVIGALQWLLLIALIAGLGWLLLAAAQVVDNGPNPFGLPAALWVAVVGGVGGVVLTVLARSMVRASARRNARRVEQWLSEVVDRAVNEGALSRIEQELGVYQKFRSGIRDATA